MTDSISVIIFLFSHRRQFYGPYLMHLQITLFSKLYTLDTIRSYFSLLIFIFQLFRKFHIKGLNPDYVNIDTLPSFWPNNIFNSLQFQSIKSKYNFKWKFWKYGIIRKHPLFYCICFGWDSVVPILREIRFHNLGFRELILCRFHLL